MGTDKQYDVFVSHYEDTGSYYAGIIKKAFAERGFQTFASSIDKKNITGNFDNAIDDIIKNCKIFVILLTYDTLARKAVIREIEVAHRFNKFPNHTWIFCDENYDFLRNSKQFTAETGITLEQFNWISFKFDTQLFTEVMVKFDCEIAKNVQSFSISSDSEREFTKTFSQYLIAKYEKKDYRAVYEEHIGGGFITDLTLHSKEETIVYEFTLHATARVEKLMQLIKYRKQIKSISPKVKVRLVLIAAHGVFSADFRKTANRYGLELFDEEDLDKNNI